MVSWEQKFPALFTKQPFTNLLMKTSSPWGAWNGDKRSGLRLREPSPSPTSKPSGLLVLQPAFLSSCSYRKSTFLLTALAPPSRSFSGTPLLPLDACPVWLSRRHHHLPLLEAIPSSTCTHKDLSASTPTCSTSHSLQFHPSPPIFPASLHSQPLRTCAASTSHFNSHPKSSHQSHQ